MKKKLLIIVLAVLLVLPVSVFAGDLFGLSIGGAAFYSGDNPLGGDFEVEDLLNVENYLLGGDLRFNVSVVELSTLLIPLQFYELEGAYYTFVYNYPSLGLVINVADILQVGAGVGTGFGLFASTVGDLLIFVGEQQISDPGNLPFLIKAAADVNLGFASIGLFSVLYSSHTIGNILDDQFDPSTISFTQPLFGMSARINLL